MQVKDMDEGVRSTVGTRLLQLTLKELFSWRFMQTDPNWCEILSVYRDAMRCKDFYQQHMNDALRLQCVVYTQLLSNSHGCC